ncbi:MAG: DnaJ domain-containing protein [Nitrospirales bacterium]|nr:DnaJ domain-containing protein [Nitrospirales bacterium]
MATLNYYAVLGVSPQALQEDIKKAYRKLALEHHPDRNQGNRNAEQKIREINAAYEILGDPDARKTYDRLRLGQMDSPNRYPEDVETQESVPPAVVVERMEGTLRDEARREMLRIMMSKKEFIKQELALIRERVIQRQGYDTFEELVVTARAEEGIDGLVTEEVQKRKTNLVDIAVEMVRSGAPGWIKSDAEQSQVRDMLDQAYRAGWRDGYVQACELFYERR